LEHVLVGAGPVQAEVAAGAPETPRPPGEGLRGAPGDPPGGGDTPAGGGGTPPPRPRRPAGDPAPHGAARPAPRPGPGRVVQHLVGAGGVTGQDDAAKPALSREGHHGPEVVHAIAEALEGRAGEPSAPAGDDVVPARVELEKAEARLVEAGRQLADQELA